MEGRRFVINAQERLAEKFVLITEVMQIYRNKYVRNAKYSNLKKEISDRQFVTLCILAYSKKNTISELSKFMHISKSTLSIIMSKMIKKGYLIKTYPAEYDDKRKIYFSLSEEGKKLLEYAQKCDFDEAKFIFSMMNDYQKECILKACERLLVSLISSDKNDIELLNLLNSLIDNDDTIGKLIYTQKIFLSELIRKTNFIVNDVDLNSENSSLTKNQFHLLVCIEKYKYNTISKLENFLNSSGSTISITISKLVKNGYVVKQYPLDNGDRRIVYINLTEKGRKAIKKMDKNLKNIFFNYVSDISEENRDYIEEGLDLLIMAFK